MSRIDMDSLRDVQYENISPILLLDCRVFTRIEPTRPGVNIKTQA